MRTLFDDPPLPPAVNQPTSIAAAESVRDRAATLRTIVFRALAVQPMTCDECERLLGMLHTTCSARIRELALLGLIEDSGDRRLTRAGRKAIVWRVRASA